MSRRLTLVAALATGVLCTAAASAQTPSTTVVSRASSGDLANGWSREPAISNDASVVAFVSSASNLVANDANGSVPDVVVWTRATASFEIVSLDANGQQPLAGAYGWVSVSSDGRFVAFASHLPLVPEDTNIHYDVYLRDRTLGRTELISVTHDGAPANNYSYETSISDDGRVVAFTSKAMNLIADPVTTFSQVYARDRSEGVTRLVSRWKLPTANALQSLGLSSAWSPGNHNSYDPDVSGDGRYVAFTTLASNFGFFDHVAHTDVYIHDLEGDDGTERVSVDATINEGNRASNSASVSDDGRYVAFSSEANNMTVTGSNSKWHIYVRDRRTRQTWKIIGSTGAEGNEISTSPDISGDGRYIAFVSRAANLVLPDNNNATDILVYDMRSLVLTRASSDWNGLPGDAASARASISDDGRFVAFESRALNLAPVGTARDDRIFLRDRATCADGSIETGRVTSLAKAPASNDPRTRDLNCDLASKGL